ncbi:hypothetical protein LO80_03435 [Candidatus Francisella endociliophora]|uniref:Band 7 domain-containing protein n=1 Tax=Candidatus Francisella endociliophora TaxID=653937 RepID=A0A097ENG8_9GAMM|nr:SPFH domain-containing protein [Francisella sp. FSC1006]AIT09111.1 hypothetical protein LO80_03435 [Francisella sp. FSC1006]
MKKILLTLSVVTLITSCTQVDTGTTAVKKSWGDVGDTTYTSEVVGYNPLTTDVLKYNTKDQSMLFPNAPIQTQDQLTAHVDMRIQYRVVPEKVPYIASNIGSEEQLVASKLKPNFYSMLRETTKSLKSVDMLFNSKVQSQIQSELTNHLNTKLMKFGIEVQQVMISSDIKLPKFIQDAIKNKKEREQQVLTQQAELDRKKIEAQQTVVEAQAKLEATKQDALSVKQMADANSYKIEKESIALSKAGDNYVRLQAVEALKGMAKDPSAKFYSLGDVNNGLLPILNMDKK